MTLIPPPDAKAIDKVLYGDNKIRDEFRTMQEEIAKSRAWNEKLDVELKVLHAEVAEYRKALVDIAKANYAGPSTDERREWTWATAYKLIKNAVTELDTAEKPNTCYEEE